MQLHHDEITTKVAPGAHAILILDQAGWHGAKQLRIPINIPGGHGTKQRFGGVGNLTHSSNV
jgi:hypothetical protein